MNRNLVEKVEALIAWGEAVDKKLRQIQADLYRLENWVRDLYAKG